MILMVLLDYFLNTSSRLLETVWVKIAFTIHESIQIKRNVLDYKQNSCLSLCGVTHRLQSHTQYYNIKRSIFITHFHKGAGHNARQAFNIVGCFDRYQNSFLRKSSVCVVNPLEL